MVESELGEFVDDDCEFGEEEVEAFAEEEEVCVVGDWRWESQVEGGGNGTGDRAVMNPP